MSQENKQALDLIPDFLIIGAGKSGTTSVDNYLKQHPEIYISPKKEPNFFGYELNTAADFEGSPEIKHYQNSVTNIDAYLELFRGAKEGQQKGETSNTYMYHDLAAERIKHYNPEVRLIAILRQPAERLYSRYLHLAREDRLPTERFEDCLNSNTIWWRRNDLVKEGFYGKHLTKFYQLFQRDQLKVILFDELKAKPEEVLKDIFKFIGVDNDIDIDFSVEYNKSGFIKNKKVDALIGQNSRPKELIKKLMPKSLFDKIKNQQFVQKKLNDVRGKNLERPKLSDQLKAELTQEIYAQDINLLGSLIQRDLSHWLK
ncbi:MAG: hypothetical protein ACI83B_000272 [Sediminicola sp.]|jgi:hypothetical protein